MPAFLCTGMAPIIISLSPNSPVPIAGCYSAPRLIEGINLLPKLNLTISLLPQQPTSIGLLAILFITITQINKQFFFSLSPVLACHGEKDCNLHGLRKLHKSHTRINPSMSSKPQSWVLIIVTDHRRPWRSQSVAGVYYSGCEEDKKVQALRFNVSRAC